MSEQSQTLYRYTLKHPMLWIGFGMFFLNHYTDTHYNVPVTDLFLPVLAGIMALPGLRLRRVLRLPGLWASVFFLAWFVISNLVNGLSFSQQLRHSVVAVTIFLPIFFYILATDKRPIMAFIIGNIIAFGFFFIVASGIDYYNGELDRSLRGIQPTPVVALAVYLFFRKRLSTPLRFVLIASGVVSFLVAIGIEARGPFLSVLLALIFWGIGRTPRLRTSLVPAMVVVLLAAHFIVGLDMKVYDQIKESKYATLSNLERGYAIDYSVRGIYWNPFFGTSPIPFPAEFAASFGAVENFYRSYDAVESPHNSYLEYSLFYGLPAGVAFLAFIWGILRAGAKLSTEPVIFSLICAGIIRLAAFYGISGWIRIEWFTLVFLLFYAAQPNAIKYISRHVQSKFHPRAALLAR